MIAKNEIKRINNANPIIKLPIESILMVIKK